MLRLFKSFLGIIVGLTLLFPNNTLGKSPVSDETPKIDFTEYDLPNGLHVILQKDSSVPVLSAYMLYHVGSKNEAPNRTGFAHFFEHLMFAGTENILADEITGFVTGVGGQMNAVTNYDHTGYYINLPSNELKLALWILADQMMNARIDSVSVETERRIVKEERQTRYDNQPYGSLYEDIVSLVFAGSRYAWVPIGSAQYVDRAKLSEFKAFYKTYYVPNNATLAISGDIDIDSTKNAITTYFSGIPRGKSVPNVTLRHPLLVSKKPKTIEKPTTPLPTTVHVWRTVPFNHPDYYALKLLSYVIGEGRSSRLYKRLIDGEQLAAEVNVTAFGLEQSGFFSIIVAGNIDSNFETLDSNLTAEMNRVCSEGITDREFKKALNRLKTELSSSYETVFSRAENLATYHALTGQTSLINTSFERYAQLIPDDIKRIAKKYLTTKKRFCLHYPPARP